jgi:hypothetical protein
MIYNNISDLKFTDMSIIAVSLGLFLYKVDMFNSKTLDSTEKTTIKSSMTDRFSNISVDRDLLASINAAIPEPKYNKYDKDNKPAPSKRLLDEYKERFADTSNDARPFVKKMQQIAYAPVAADITRAGHHTHSVRRIYDEELDKAGSSIWYEVNNELDDKLYDMVKTNKLGIPR